MVAGGNEGENLREVLHPAAPGTPVNPEVLDSARLTMPAQISDHVLVGDNRIEQTPEAQLAYAQSTAIAITNQFLLRRTQLTPAEFKVMGGVIDLCFKTGAVGEENKGQINESLLYRAGMQNNPNAALGLRRMAEKVSEIKLPTS